MPADFSALNATSQNLVAQSTALADAVTKAVTVLGNLQGQVQQAVEAALTADNAADNNSIAAANTAIQGVFDANAAQINSLLAAVPAPPSA